MAVSGQNLMMAHSKGIDTLQFNASCGKSSSPSPTTDEEKCLLSPNSSKSNPVIVINKVAMSSNNGKAKNGNGDKVVLNGKETSEKPSSPKVFGSKSEKNNQKIGENMSAPVNDTNMPYENELPQNKLSRIAKIGVELPALYFPNQPPSFVYQGSPVVGRHQGSFKIYKQPPALEYKLSGFQDNTPPNSEACMGNTGSDSGSQISKLYSDAISTRSWTSVGLGSTDGKKMIVRRVPANPVELFNIVNPPTPPEEYLFDQSDDGSDETETDYLKPRRQQWSNKLQFVLACIGYSVGIGSVWRFPYLCYKSGGGVFLIPYFIIMIICGIPMLYMELAVGQYTGRGPIGAIGHLCPLLKGTGLASVIISFLMSTYYSVIIAYGIYYFFTSFKPVRTWVECSNKHNTENCWVPGLSENFTRPSESQTPAEQFYELKVLKISNGIEEFGYLRWELVACLMCAWILVYFAIWKSIKSSAKVRYVTATLPFLLIIVFLIKSVTLEGADKGLRYFFRPKWELLADAKVWVNALAQNLNSMGLAYGSMISFASYNKFNNAILPDTIAVAVVNAVTSIIVGIFTFATIGNIALEQNTTIENVISDGPGLIFVVYPQAIGKMPAAHLWAVLFFFMLLCLVLNSQFAIVEVVVTSIQDGFPQWIKKHLMCHEMLVFLVCAISFLCGLPNVTHGGIYFFQLIDHYTASISIMLLAFLELIAICWFYGVWRLCKNVEAMNARSPSLYFKFCWMIAAPFLIFSIWIFYLVDYESPTYNNGTYHYPSWAVAIGWIIASISILAVPIFSIYILAKDTEESFWEKVKNALQPDLYECEKCGQHFCEHLDNIDDENEPMLVLRTSDMGNQNLASPSTPTYTPVTNSPIINRPAGNLINNVSNNGNGRLNVNSSLNGNNTLSGSSLNGNSNTSNESNNSGTSNSDQGNNDNT